MHCGQERCAQDFSGETEGNKPLGIPRVIWEDNTKMNLKETEIDDVELIHFF